MRTFFFSFIISGFFYVSYFILDLLQFFSFCRNLENNKLEGPLPQSLNKATLEIRYGISALVFKKQYGSQYFDLSAEHLGICASPFPQPHVMMHHPILLMRRLKLLQFLKASTVCITI